jgi:hypothetical protein
MNPEWREARLIELPQVSAYSRHAPRTRAPAWPWLLLAGALAGLLSGAVLWRMPHGYTYAPGAALGLAVGLLFARRVPHALVAIVGCAAVGAGTYLIAVTSCMWADAWLLRRLGAFSYSRMWWLPYGGAFAAGAVGAGATVSLMGLILRLQRLTLRTVFAAVVGGLAGMGVYYGAMKLASSGTFGGIRLNYAIPLAIWQGLVAAGLGGPIRMRRPR